MDTTEKHHGLHSYTKILALGHRALEPLADQVVVVEEKVDGSQFSFGVRDGVLLMRSKGATIYGLEGCQKLFAPTVKHVMDCHAQGLLVEGWTYRGEAFCSPRHNTLAYERVPAGHFVLFDVDLGLEAYAVPGVREQIAADLGVEPIAVLDEIQMSALTEACLNEYLKTTSALGKALVEGIVVKPTACVVGVDGKRLLGKFVSEAFKETHSKTWVSGNAQKQDVVASIGEAIATPARWRKSVLRLRDEGRLTESLQDIGPLIAAVQQDVVAESEDEIKEMLYAAYRKEVLRASTRGLPEWYKRELAFGGVQ